MIRPVASRVEVRFVMLGTIRTYHGPVFSGRRTSRPAGWHLPTTCSGEPAPGQVSSSGPEGPVVVGRYDDTAADLDAVLDWASATGRREWPSSWPPRSPTSGSRPGDSPTGCAVPSAAGGRRAICRTAGRAAPRRQKLGLSPHPLGSGRRRAARRTRDARHRLDHRDGGPLSPRGVLVVTGAAEEGAALARRRHSRMPNASGATAWSPIALSVLAIARAIAGDPEGERSFHERRLAIVSERGDVARLADTLNTLAEIALDKADAATARAYASESCRHRGGGAAAGGPGRDDHLGQGGRRGRRPGCHGGSPAGCFHVGRPHRSIACPGAVSAGRRVPGGTQRRAQPPRCAPSTSAREVSASPSGTDEPIEADLAARLAEARAALEEDGFRRRSGCWAARSRSRPCAPRSKPWLHSRFPRPADRPALNTPLG